MIEEIKSNGIDPLIYLTGKSFFDASVQIRTAFFEPKAVNQALAAELLLKSLNRELSLKIHPAKHSDHPEKVQIEKSQTTMRGHNLKILFGELEKVVQDEIKIMFELDSDIQIEQALDDIKDIFVECRYSYEKNGITVAQATLEHFCNTLISYIELRMNNGNYGTIRVN